MEAGLLTNVHCQPTPQLTTMEVGSLAKVHVMEAGNLAKVQKHSQGKRSAREVFIEANGVPKNCCGVKTLPGL